LKIALSLFKYFPYGGLQRDFLRIAKECIRRGHEVHVYTMSWEGERDPEIPVTLIPVKGFQNHTRCKQFAKKFLAHAKNYDLILGFNKMPGLDFYYAADTCYQAKAREQHGAWYRLLPRYRHLVNFENAVFSEKNHTNILLISKLQQPIFQKFYQTSNQRFHLLPPGISRDRIAPDNADLIRKKMRAEWNISENDFLLLMVGSGFKTKGLDRALHAIAALPENLKQRTKLFVIGKDHSENFITLAKKLKITEQITFLGGRDDVPNFLLAADLLLHPAYNENTGTVILEALVSGLPVIATDICGYADYILQADAGVVLKSPFEQSIFNETLANTLNSSTNDWRNNALTFSKSADIFSMPERAVDILCHSEQKIHFDDAMQLRGEIYRELEGRRTQKIKIDGKNYFIKQHFGVGWKEIFKNLFQLRLPVLGAKNEWRAIQKLNSLGIKTAELVAYGSRGMNPARKQSFVMMKELENQLSLEDLCRDWKKNPPAFQFKNRLIKQVAELTKTMHENGINHRDYYLCHILTLRDGRCAASSGRTEEWLTILDLHRAQIRAKTPTRWLIKDLAGLYFSSQDIGLTHRDLLRFMKHYRKTPLRNIFKQELNFWKKVKQRADDLYQKHEKN
jgi:UDP-glucose:(heptosyl)LPS alpha-1,3-glucosyltransferase